MNNLRGGGEYTRYGQWHVPFELYLSTLFLLSSPILPLGSTVAISHSCLKTNSRASNLSTHHNNFLLLPTLNSQYRYHEPHLFFVPISSGSIRARIKVLLRRPSHRPTPSRSQQQHHPMGGAAHRSHPTQSSQVTRKPSTPWLMEGRIGSQGPHPPGIDESQVDRHRHYAHWL